MSDTELKNNNLPEDEHVDHSLNEGGEDSGSTVSDDPQTDLEQSDKPTPTIVMDRSAIVDSAERPALIDGNEAEAPPAAQHVEKEDVVAAEDEEADKRQIKISCHQCGQKLDLTYMEPFSIIECPTCSEKIIVPKWFDNYLLEEPGGIGGMATVYRALDLSLDREVAIKVLNPELAQRKERSDLFLNEARTAATINHFGVIPVYTCGEFEEQPFIIMQYMDGGSLEDKLKLERTPLPIADVCGWIRDVAEGLDNARRHGIIHHDIKPGNIMLDADGNAKIGDFGIAQAIHDTKTDQVYELTKTWLSPHYVSPEKVATGREDYLGDVYSLGATFYHLVTGKTPFDHDDVQQLIRSRLVTDPIEPEKIRSDIPVKVSNLVMSMMKREMDDRPNYREVIKAINHCVKELQKSAVKKTQKKVPVKNKFVTGSVDPAKRAKRRAALSQKRNPFVSWAYSLGICSILAIACVYLYKSGSGKKLINRLLNKKNVDNVVPADLNRDVTWAFRQGNSSQAENHARQIFEDATTDLNKRAQAGVQYAMAAFLNNEPGAEERALLVAERLQASGLDEGDVLLAIVYFLSNREIAAKALKQRLEIDQYAKPLGEAAILLRGIYHDEPALTIDSYFVKCERAAEYGDSSFWGNAWKDRLDSWRKVLRSGIGDRNALEPLFVQKVTKHVDDDVKKFDSFESRMEQKKQNNNGFTVQGSKQSSSGGQAFSSTSLADFTQSRTVFSQRPYLDSASIDYDRNAIQHYLDKLPNKELKKQELERFTFIKDTKEYLISLFARSEYSGPVALTRRTIANGQISLANVNGLFVKRRANGSPKKYKWDDLKFQQYINFFEYFANERAKVIGPDMTEEERKKLVADEYLHLAVLCDWHGKYKEAFKYAKKSVNVYPKYRAKVSNIFMGN